ncbi:MAG TPA: polysaccharide biosynthesis tyrosine autokinase [Desulfobulbus sp.]|nr:polysaccharide biosynthesis tyrosine autokinase [Desulfobulbus sp.]
MGKVFKALSKAGTAGTTGGQGRPEEPVDGSVAPASGTRPPESGQEQKVPASPAAAGAWDERLLMATTVAGAAAESFRNLRTRILHPPDREIPRTLLVTSATPGEGKSFVSANLGVSLAQGVDTYSLLVDCDLRKPSLHTFFGLSNEGGLVDHLREGRDVGPLFVNCGIRKLSLLPAGPPPVNPAELVGAKTMIRLVHEVADRYDDRIIIFDSPPVQAASETLVLAKQVDGIILVVRWGGSRREHVQDLLDLVGREKIVAVVFNAYRATLFDTKLFGAYEYQEKYYYSVK